jgi:hypothetical protein
VDVFGDEAPNEPLEKFAREGEEAGLDLRAGGTYLRDGPAELADALGVELEVDAMVGSGYFRGLKLVLTNEKSSRVSMRISYM